MNEVASIIDMDRAEALAFIGRLKKLKRSKRGGMENAFATVLGGFPRRFRGKTGLSAPLS
jgi:hypothetical protein